MTLATIYLSRVGVVGNFFAAALMVRTVAMPLAVAALNIGVGPCWVRRVAACLRRWRALSLAEIEPFHSTPIRRVKLSRDSLEILLDVNLRFSSKIAPGSQSEATFLRSA